MKSVVKLVLMATALCCSHQSVASDRQDVDVWKRADAKQGNKTVSTKANSGMQPANSAALKATEDKTTRDWTGLTLKAQRKMVSEYAAVFDLFAKELAPFGGDVESLWAADTAHALAQQIQSGYWNYETCLAKINVMQSCVGYGLSYLPVLMVSSAHTRMSVEGPTPLDVVQANIDDANRMYKKVAIQTSPNMKRLSSMSFLSWLNFISFYKCRNFFEDGQVFSLEQTDASDEIVRALASLADSIMALPYSNKAKFRAMFLLEANACMSALTPLYSALNETEDEAKFQMRLLRDFYEIYLPLEVKAKDGSIQEFTDEEFEEIFALYFSNLKVLYLKYLISNLKRCNETEAERNDEKIWEETVQENTISAYDDYIKYTQRKTHLDEAFAARKRLSNLKLCNETEAAERTDEEMWEETVQENTLEAYDKYIKFTQRQTHLKEAFAARKRLNNVK